MYMSLYISGLLPLDDRNEPQFFVHIFMYGRLAQRNSFSGQEYPHGTMTELSVSIMIDFLDFIA